MLDRFWGKNDIFNVDDVVVKVGRQRNVNFWQLTLAAPQRLLVELRFFIDVDLQRETQIVDQIECILLRVMVLEEAVCKLQHETLELLILRRLDVEVFEQ